MAPEERSPADQQFGHGPQAAAGRQHGRAEDGRRVVTTLSGTFPPADPQPADPPPSPPPDPGPIEPLAPMEVPEPGVVDVPEPGVVDVPERRV